MLKKILLVMFLSLCCTGLSHAQGTEEIILTTYYPAPYGEYYSLSVGSGYVAPAEDGNLIIEGKVGIGTPNPEEALHVAGKVRLGADPYDDMDAATKQYVDAQSGGGGPGAWSCQLREGSFGTQSMASCLAGTTLITGGCEHGAPTPPIVTGRPMNNGWYCLVGSPYIVKAYAWCCE
jgi:hypothetical protein